MTKLARIAVTCLLLALAACNDKPKTYQGWVEANLIFVAPDEAERIDDDPPRQRPGVNLPEVRWPTCATSHSRLAQSKGVGPATLIREWVLEKLHHA